tara:strand:+ start:7695 stop:7931 length:237 start_codon:yes stop_codon:yes gene_type:complete
MNNDIEEKIKNIMITILQIEEKKLYTVKRGDSPEWDSMAWVNIIAALEDELDIEFNDDEYELVSSYELICELIKIKSK